jgi:hypothetical protein
VSAVPRSTTAKAAAGKNAAIKLDSAGAKAVDVARAALEAEVPVEDIGDHLQAVADAERVVTHFFQCLNTGYAGWRWAVTVMRAPRAKNITVSDIVLRLTAGFTGNDELDGLTELAPLHPSQWEIGLGRERVLSPEGWLEAARRWHEGDYGPSAPMARGCELNCATCGFLVALGGPLGQAFGLCAQAMSPADGHVVALDYGCGAHSQVTEEVVVHEVLVPVTDELNYDILDLGHS